MSGVAHVCGVQVRHDDLESSVAVYCSEGRPCWYETGDNETHSKINSTDGVYCHTVL